MWSITRGVSSSAGGASPSAWGRLWITSSAATPNANACTTVSGTRRERRPILATPQATCTRPQIAPASARPPAPWSRAMSASTKLIASPGPESPSVVPPHRATTALAMTAQTSAIVAGSLACWAASKASANEGPMAVRPASASSRSVARRHESRHTGTSARKPRSSRGVGNTFRRSLMVRRMPEDAAIGLWFAP
jgi:hypothetical protein